MKDDPPASTGGSQTDKRYIAELEAKLANAALEMEKAKAQLVPPALTLVELEKLMAQALPISPDAPSRLVAVLQGSYFSLAFPARVGAHFHRA